MTLIIVKGNIDNIDLLARLHYTVQTCVMKNQMGHVTVSVNWVCASADGTFGAPVDLQLKQKLAHLSAFLFVHSQQRAGSTLNTAPHAPVTWLWRAPESATSQGQRLAICFIISCVA